MVTRTAYILISILTVPAFLTSSTFSFGQSGRTYNYGHIRYAEGEVTLQRALELEAAEAAINVPVMPGDRMWTATYGRAEVLFADGSVLQMDERTKVDFTAFGETAGAETLLRLWNGILMLRIIAASAAAYRIDTPAGSIFSVSEGLFRIDVDETGIATVSVYEGVAELASETGSVLVRTGQRSFVQQGLRPESPFEFNTALYDAFASWSDGREQLHRHARRIEGVPNEVAVYAGELQHYGNWRHDASYGQVWYPTVGAPTRTVDGLIRPSAGLGSPLSLGDGLPTTTVVGGTAPWAGTGYRELIGDRLGSLGLSGRPGWDGLRWGTTTAPSFPTVPCLTIVAAVVRCRDTGADTADTAGVSPRTITSGRAVLDEASRSSARDFALKTFARPQIRDDCSNPERS